MHGVMQNIKGFAFVILFRMDHAIIFKGTRSSVAAPHPFEIPLLAFVSRIPRTGFLPDAADARVVSDCVGQFRVFSVTQLLRLCQFFITHLLPRLPINGSLCLIDFNDDIRPLILSRMGIDSVQRKALSWNSSGRPDSLNTSV